jgi:curved DNA-binding protein CbpA
LSHSVMNPYLVLGVPVQADDQTIRRAYLEAIKQATPEKNPARFKAVSEAYERIKDESSRCKYELFHQESPGASPLDTVLRHLRMAAKPKPMSMETMKEFLHTCSKM